MHKRTAHAVVDGDDCVDAFLQDSLESSSQNRSKKQVKETVSITRAIFDYLLNKCLLQ